MENETQLLNEPDFDYPGTYSYADYLRWTIEERVELIKGKIFKMSGPLRRHQVVAGSVFAHLWMFLEDKQCKVYQAPFDIRFPKKSKEDKDIFTVLQPDVCVVCDPSKLDDRGCIGAPDIVVEVLSPSNNKKELRNKYNVYEEHGVKEYWILHPSEKTFFRYLLGNDGKFIPTHLLTEGDVVTTIILPGFELVLDKVFQED